MSGKQYVGLADRLVSMPGFNDYRLLKNYALHRKKCYTEEGKLMNVLFTEDAREQYAKTYENRLGVDLNPVYNLNIIAKNLEDVMFISDRRDGIIFTILYASNIMELRLDVKRYKDRESNPQLSISSFINNRDIRHNFLHARLGKDQYSDIMREECEIMKKMFGFEIHLEKSYIIKPENQI
jgi:hypothetical protein